MKIDAIVYTSCTGHTKAYAEMLGRHTGLSVYTLAEAKTKLAKGAAVIYLGWLMAGKVKDYGKAKKRYQTAAVIGVGLGDTGAQDEACRKANKIAEDIPVFTVQGGMEYEKLKGINRLMIDMLRKMLSGKKDRTAEEDAMLALIVKGGNYISEEHLDAVYGWYRNEQGGQDD